MNEQKKEMFGRKTHTPASGGEGFGVKMIFKIEDEKMNPVNPTELKSWIVKHANYYRKEKRKAYDMARSDTVINHFEGHMRAMRVLWDDLKRNQNCDFMGLFKTMEPEMITTPNETEA